MALAETCALRSPDAQTKVGAVLVNNSSGAVIATGYNGFVRGAPDQLLPNTRPDKYMYIIHAEQNLICNSARHGISTNDTTLVCTHSPCTHCIRLIYNSGINCVIFKHKRPDFDLSLSAPDFQITFTQNSSGFFIINFV
jgi:dCMP deaminase